MVKRERGLSIETAARRAVTRCIHWGRTEHRLRALRRRNHFLTEILHHHSYNGRDTGA